VHWLVLDELLASSYRAELTVKMLQLVKSVSVFVSVCLLVSMCASMSKGMCVQCASNFVASVQ
jgi:hypothetical protein